MSLLDNSIGDFAFLALAGEIEPPREILEIEERAGIQGSEVTRMGAKGRPFVLQSRVDLQSYEEAKTLLDDYLGLVGADPVSVTQGGVTSQYLFIVLNINVLRIPPVAGGVGGFNSNPRALLECRWTLLAIPPFE